MQREAVQITEGPLLVVAGAGSGKTRMLTVRIAYLIECCHVEPSQILAVTFTNKAAKEMKERVSNLVVGASAVTLTTFHAFCCRLLRRWSKYAGFEKGFTIYDQSDSEKLLKNTLKELKYDTKTFPVAICAEAIS
ncbi:MAG: UvrD-helicase domain-containing protein, partial [Candidatus Riflebacteria bacterium]|nr:UvrD-helicase domain-containing protein [Candidatus Riflebacteria bacterium]